MKTIKHIAIIAFDNKKTDLIEWSYFNKHILQQHEIAALGFAANILEGTLNKSITALEDGKLGGYRKLYNRISEGKIDILIIFGEPAEIFESRDLKAVFEFAVKNNIVVSANRSTADFVVYSSLMENDYLISNKEKKPAADTVAGASFPLAKAS